MGPLAAALDYRKVLIYPRKAQDAHYVGARIEQYQLPAASRDMAQPAEYQPEPRTVHKVDLRQVEHEPSHHTVGYCIIYLFSYRARSMMIYPAGGDGVECLSVIVHLANRNIHAFHLPFYGYILRCSARENARFLRAKTDFLNNLLSEGYELFKIISHIVIERKINLSYNYMITILPSRAASADADRSTLQTMERNIKRITEEQIGTQYGYMARVRELLGDRPRGVYMQTFGCQQNEADSERLCGMAEEMGYTVVSEPEEADLILVNTCAIREHAELKTLSIAGQFKHIKEKNPDLLIGICGCMVSQEHRIDDIKNKYPYIDFLFGTSDNYRFPEILYDKLTRGKRQFFENGEEGTVAEGLPVHRFSDFKAWVSIMYGCNNYCTYCVVPYVRGRERSRRREDILEEVRGLADAGYREITLLGQNVNSYGSDGVNGDGYAFADLLEDICKIDGNFTVRFMTSHPKDVSEKLTDVIADNPKIARQFHLPLQSGSDRILREMNRHYDTARYLSAVDYMRRRIPDISLSTDIIVAFPGETEQDFEDTLSMLRRVRYDSIYSFIYSPRKGTRAAAMDGQIPPEVSRERFARLLEVQNGISLELNREFEGRDVDVLVEGISKTDDSRLTGRMERGRLVHFAGDPSLTGSHVRVHIDRAETYALYGTLVCGE